MQFGKKKKFELDVSREKLAKMSPGIDVDLVNNLTKYFDKHFEKVSSPLYIFLKPDLEHYAKQFAKPEKDIYSVLAYLATFRRDVIQLKKILIKEDRDLFYILQEEDIEELKHSNLLHDPEDPRIVYHNADKFVRHAFVLDPVGNVLC